MTTRTPTNNLPDEATLAQLATAMFQQFSGNAAPPHAAAPFSPEHPVAHTGIPVGTPVTITAANATLPAEQMPSAPSFYFLETGIPRRPAAAAPFELPSPEAAQLFLDALNVPLPDAAPRHQTLAQPGQRFYFAEHDARAAPLPALPQLDPIGVRRDFPILAEKVNGKPLIWFDNAATTHKPQAVIDRIAWFYAHENSNIHRAAHALAARATDAYEAAREKVRRFLGAAQIEEIIFVRGTTEAINFVANTWGEQHIAAGDEILLSHLEHHANIVPWQMLAQRKGAKIKVIPVDDSGQLRLDALPGLLNERTKLVALTQVSNALGTVTPVPEVIALAHAAGAKVLVDGAQAVSHLRVSVQALDADFYVFSGHKVFGPTGIGVVYGKRAILETLPPWEGGGNMIADVTFEHTEYQGVPQRFEAGTGNIADAVGLGAAIDYVEKIGIENIAAYEHWLLDYATGRLREIPGLRLIGTAAHKASVASFVIDGYTTVQIGDALSKEGIAVRSGHHCAQPILRRFGLEATVRPSLAFYNTCGEVDHMIATLHKLVRRGSGV
ncbi:MAG: cysteine desulfurase [Azonexus sp.]|jgi:cysteine desulfurase/selenocysteine lyase|nr:cysteine desulfurase [Azonexus sp.]